MSQQFIGEFFDQDTDIAIENSAGSGRPAAGRFRVEFAPTNDNALLFEGILKMQRDRVVGRRGRFAGSRRVSDPSRRRGGATPRLSAGSPRGTSEDHDAAVALLALSGLIAGKGGASDARGLLAAAMGAGEPSKSETQPDRWRTLVDMTSQRHGVVREFVLQAAHVSKSTTDPSGVDGRQFTGALRAFAADWSLPALSEAAPRQVQALRQILETRLEPALEEAHVALGEWYDDVVRLVGDADSATDRSKQWRATLDAAQADGFLVRARGYADDGAPAQMGATIRIVQGSSVSGQSGPRSTRVLDREVPWARLPAVRDHLSALEATLLASLEKARTQHGERRRIRRLRASSARWIALHMLRSSTRTRNERTVAQSGSIGLLPSWRARCATRLAPVRTPTW